MDTYAALIRKTAKALEAARIDNPRREARLLVALAAEFDTAMLIARERDRVPADVLGRLQDYVGRRSEGEPFAHIRGQASFYGLDFICDARALVPRPDSEIVVERALELLPRGRGLKIADLGTGSGCLLIAILTMRGGVQGVGVEADPQAAALARENVKRHQMDPRARIVHERWEAWRGWGEVDMIVSNPPYIERAVIDTLARDVRAFDPIQALDGGPDGLKAYRQIIALAAQQMKPGSHLVFEIGYDQDEAVRGLMQVAGFVEIGGVRDLGGHDRVVHGVQANCLA
jgi:release factor glutamine methyltransferase